MSKKRRVHFINPNDGKFIPHYDLAENIKYFDNTTPKLGADNVQTAIENLVNKTGPIPNPNEGGIGGAYYKIDPDEWGIVLCENIPIRGQHYFNTKAEREAANASQYPDYNFAISYEEMHNNAVAIERAMDYAYEQGYNTVVFTKGIYYTIPENMASRALSATSNSLIEDFLPTINIFNKENFTIDFNGSIFYWVLDTSRNPSSTEGFYRNPYYSPPVGKTSIFTLGSLFELNCCDQVTLQNGILCGDLYTRSFSFSSEISIENTYGITTGSYVYNTVIKNMDISGFMGDAIGSGAMGDDVRIRDYRGTPETNPGYGIYNARYNRHRYIDDNRSDINPTTSIVPVIRPFTALKGKKSFAVRYSFFKGGAYTDSVAINGDQISTVITDESANCIVSEFLGVNEDNLNVDYGGTYSHMGMDLGSDIVYPDDNKYTGALTIPFVRKLIDRRRFAVAAGTGINVDWTRMSVLAFSIPTETVGNVECDFIECYIDSTDDNDNPIYVKYYLDLRTCTLYNANKVKIAYNSSTNDSLYNTVLKEAYSQDIRKTKGIYDNNGVLEYYYYDGAAGRLYSITGALQSSSGNANYSAIVNQLKTRYGLLAPVRVIHIKSLDDFYLLKDENYVRIQVWGYKAAYGEPSGLINQNGVGYPDIRKSFDNLYPNHCFRGSYGQLRTSSTSTGSPFSNQFSLTVQPNSGLIVTNCKIHDCFRGGVTGGMRDFALQSSVFYKVRVRNGVGTINNINQYGEVPRFGDPTNYALDIEEGFTRNMEMSNCVIYDNTVFVLSGIQFKFFNNICMTAIGIRNILNTDIHDNVFLKDTIKFESFRLGNRLSTKSDLQSEDDGDDEIDVENLYLSDNIGNGPGFVDLKNSAASRLVRTINVYNNVFYGTNGHLWSIYNRHKTVINCHDNIFHIANDYSNIGNLRVFRDNVVKVVKNSSFYNNTIINDYEYLNGKQALSNYDGINHNIEWCGDCYNNRFINRSSHIRFNIVPLGSSFNNFVTGASIILGRRHVGTSSEKGAPANSSLRGITYGDNTTLDAVFGIPDKTLLVEDCTFDGLLTVNPTFKYFNAYHRPEPPKAIISRRSSADAHLVVTLEHPGINYKYKRNNGDYSALEDLVGKLIRKDYQTTYLGYKGTNGSRVITSTAVIGTKSRNYFKVTDSNDTITYTEVDTLPDPSNLTLNTIYYNTTDGKYYIVNIIDGDKAFVEYDTNNCILQEYDLNYPNIYYTTNGLNYYIYKEPFIVFPGDRVRAYVVRMTANSQELRDTSEFFDFTVRTEDINHTLSYKPNRLKAVVAKYMTKSDPSNTYDDVLNYELLEYEDSELIFKNCNFNEDFILGHIPTKVKVHIDESQTNQHINDTIYEMALGKIDEAVSYPQLKLKFYNCDFSNLQRDYLFNNQISNLDVELVNCYPSNFTAYNENV